MWTVKDVGVRSQLKPHNLKALFLLEDALKLFNKVVLVHPTGAGKSAVMMGYIEGIFDRVEKIIVVEPYLSIEYSHKNSGLWNPKWDSKVRYITYSYLSRIKNMSYDGVESLGLTGLGLVVFDEVHHIDAPVWVQGFKQLERYNPNCKFLGLTATPTRYLDGGVNVAKKHFDGNELEILTLTQAIKDGIFARPIYVTALYDIDNILSELELDITKSSLSDEAKRALYSKLARVKIDWEKQGGIPDILERYINTYLVDVDNLKFPVFMQNISELERYKPIVEQWFKKSGLRLNVNSYVLYSGCGQGDEEVLNAFQVEHKNSVDLLFVVNKLNEGVHLDYTSGVIILRHTISPNLHYQIIGRAFKSGMSRSPIIFDFVNNFAAVKAVQRILIEEGELPINLSAPSKSKRGGTRRARGYRYSTGDFFTETYDIIDVWTEIQNRLNIKRSIWESDVPADWLQCCSELKQFLLTHLRIPELHSEFNLATWLRLQLKLFKEGRLADWQIEKLKECGIVLSK